MIGFSAETNEGITLSRHRADDGTGIIIEAWPVGEGFGVRLFGLDGASARREKAASRLSANQAVAFRAQLRGRPCAVVVHVGASPEGTREAALSTYHEPFMEAAQRYPLAHLVGMKVDYPRDPRGAFSFATFMAQAIADDMMAKALQDSYR